MRYVMHVDHDERIPGYALNFPLPDDPAAKHDLDRLSFYHPYLPTVPVHYDAAILMPAAFYRIVFEHLHYVYHLIPILRYVCAMMYFCAFYR